MCPLCIHRGVVEGYHYLPPSKHETGMGLSLQEEMAMQRDVCSKPWYLHQCKLTAAQSHATFFQHSAPNGMHIL